jgi:hypothetical protein
MTETEIGVVWPLDSLGKSSSTRTGKAVWQASVQCLETVESLRSAAAPSPTAVSESIAREKGCDPRPRGLACPFIDLVLSLDWRFKYVNHLKNVARLAASSEEAVLKHAESGLAKVCGGWRLQGGES